MVGVDLVGPSSLVTLIESFPDYWKPFLQGTWYTYVGDPAIPEEREDMLSRSAISRIDDIKVPLLVGQGANDPRVTKLESDQLVEAMADRELPVTYVNFPDEGHGFQRPENRLAFYSVMEGFLESCLGGESEPVNDAFDGSTIEILHGERKITLRSKILSRKVGDREGALASSLSLAPSTSDQEGLIETRARILLRTVTIILLRQDLL